MHRSSCSVARSVLERLQHAWTASDCVQPARGSWQGAAPGGQTPGPHAAVLGSGRAKQRSSSWQQLNEEMQATLQTRNSLQGELASLQLEDAALQAREACTQACLSSLSEVPSVAWSGAHPNRHVQARMGDVRERAAPSSSVEQQAQLDAQRASMEADVSALKAEYTRLLQERSQLQGDVQVGAQCGHPGRRWVPAPMVQSAVWAVQRPDACDASGAAPRRGHSRCQARAAGVRQRVAHPGADQARQRPPEGPAGPAPAGAAGAQPCTAPVAVRRRKVHQGHT